MRISDWSSDVCSSDLREPLNACAVHDERAGPADHAAEVGGTCARGHGQGRTIQRDIAPCRAAPVQVRKAVVEAVKVQQYARDIAEGHGAGAEGAGRTGAQDTSLDYRSARSEEHTSELQSLMRISYAVFCLKKKSNHQRRRH